MRISSITPPATGKRRWILHFEDGSLLRVGLGELSDFALHEDMELDEETFARLTAAAGQEEARQRALALVTRRPHSEAELLRKLRERRIDPACAREAADWLTELGLLDDAAYAKTLAEHYAAKGYGVHKIRHELIARGVDRTHWDEALAVLEPPAAAIDDFLNGALGVGAPPDAAALRRAAAALERRGFSRGDIASALRRHRDGGAFD